MVVLLVFKIENDDPRQTGDDNLFHPLVLGMGQISVAASGGADGHDEAVGESVIEAFRAVIGAVLHREQAGDFADGDH